MFLRMPVAMMMLALIANSPWAGETNPPTHALQLSVGLVDGSRIVGTPATNTVRFMSSLGNFQVPFERIKKLTVGNDHETVTLELSNGDRLTGVVTPDPLFLTATWGKVRIGMEHVGYISPLAGATCLFPTLHKGLVLYYSFDTDSGETVTDQSEFHKDGRVQGPKWTANGKVGGAYDFNGRSDYIQGPNVMTDFRRFTVLAWVNIRSFTHEHYMGIASQMGFDQDNGGYVFYAGADLLGTSAWWNDGSSMETGSPQPLSLGEWHLIAQTYDGSVVMQYVDGKLNKKANYQDKVIGNRDDFQIGKVAAYPGKRGITVFFDGLIDEVLIFNRALSESEIKQLYDAQN